MLFLSQKKLNEIIDSRISEIFTKTLTEAVIYQLDETKNYILFVPTELSEEAVRKAFAGLAGNINLVVLRVDNARLLELS